MAKIRPFVSVFAILVAVVLVAGCGGKTTAASSPSAPGQISVAIGQSSTNMIGGATQTFTASVANDSANAGVTWTATTGTITASGLYTAPAPVKVALATVTATSKSDPTRTASASITLMPITMTIAPATLATMGSGAFQVLTATVANDGSNGGVIWTASAGSLSTTTSLSGVAVTYTAPSPVSTFTAVVTATSITDPTRSASATIPLMTISPNPISPVSVSLGAGGSQVFTDSVAYDLSNSGVSWSITSGPGTLSAASGTSVTYNAPATVIAAATPVTLTATSIKDPTRSTTANITLNRASVSITPTNPTAMLGGATQAFTATVANDGTNAGVTWTVSGGGSFSSSTTLSGVPTTYTAASPATATSATLTATSKADSTKSASVAVILTPIAISLTSASAFALDGNGAQTIAVSASITGDASGSGATFVVSGGGAMSASLVSGNAPGATYTVPVVSAQTNATIIVTSVKDPTKSQIVTVTLNPPLSFTTPQGALTAMSAGSTYAGASIVVAGGTGTRTFTLTTGLLPAGLALSSTGVITGTATGAVGTSNFTVQVIDQASPPMTISGTFSLAVGTGPPVWVSPSAGTQTYTVGTAISPIALSATGGTGAITYTLSSGTLLPAGLQIVGNQVTGTPTAPTIVTGNVVTFLATDSATPTAATSISSGVTFIANPVALAITSTALPGATAAVVYSDQLISSGGTGTIVWTLTVGSLTGTGLTLSNAGLLSGTPTAANSGLSLTFEAQDSATNQQQMKTVTLLLNIAGPPVITSASGLPTAPLGLAYNQALAAAGGSGSGYSWTVTSGATGSNSLAALNLSVSSAGVITGTPTIAGTANFTVQVKDSANNTASSTFSVSTAPALSLPAPNPVSLGAGTITIPYSGTITATGGISGYTWTVNGSAVPTNGASVGLVDNLSINNSGGATLSVSGTPTATGTVSFTASVRDNAGTIVGPFTYAIGISNFFTVGGQINSQVDCNTSGLTGVTVSINTSPAAQIATTNANGSFSFSNVPNGTYIITPSIVGSSVAFYPATQTVTVNNSNLSAPSFTATLGYTVSGTVAYTGTHQGQIYLALNPTGNCGGRSPGTSVSSTGAYSIRGVPPGNYTLQAFMDTVGDGVPNAANPTGSTPGVSPTHANISGVALTLGDPASVTLTTAPTLTYVSPFNSGVFVQYKPITNSVGLEMATYYILQWSLSPTFDTLDGSKGFFANGTLSDVWLLRGLTNGNVYYFRAFGTSGGTLLGPTSQIVGPILIGAPTAGNEVTGSVSFASPATGPLYLGYYDQGSGAFYGQYVISPVSGQPFTMYVPTGSDYLLLGVLDQNNDGAIGAGDITNTGNGSSTPVIAIQGPTVNQSFTLPNTDGIATVTTQNLESVTPAGVAQNYNINFTVNGSIKRPVAVSLVSGQNLITPVDIAICGGSGSTCGQGFQISFNLYSTIPSVGDNYVFNVTYSDGTTGTLSAAVTAVLNGFAANLAPQTGTSASTTPTFTWTDPLQAAAYTYQFYLTDSNSNVIWQLPKPNAASNGFSSAITTIPWKVDPSGGGSLPAIPSLVPGTTYSWQILVQDGSGNSTATQVQYQP